MTEVPGGFTVTVSGGSPEANREIEGVLRRIVDDFLACDVGIPGFAGFGLHVRGCACGNCDGSGGVPGGLVTAIVREVRMR